MQDTSTELIGKQCLEYGQGKVKQQGILINTLVDEHFVPFGSSKYNSQSEASIIYNLN